MPADPSNAYTLSYNNWKKKNGNNSFEVII